MMVSKETMFEPRTEEGKGALVAIRLGSEHLRQRKDYHTRATAVCRGRRTHGKGEEGGV